MKILMYGNRKTGPNVLCYDITTPEQEETGYRLLFEFLHNE